MSGSELESATMHDLLVVSDANGIESTWRSNSDLDRCLVMLTCLIKWTKREAGRSIEHEHETEQCNADGGLDRPDFGLRRVRSSGSLIKVVLAGWRL